MKYISLFSGIEAATVAWESLGWTPVAFSEVEPFCCALLQHRYPAVPNLGDVTMVDWSEYRGKVDLVVGGPPCQAFSVAGLRESMNDHRGNLSLEYVRVIHAIEPTWSITENVPGWLSTKDNAFGCFLAGLVGADAPLVPTKECGGRWTDAGLVTGPRRTAAWRILDAEYFGLAQRRERVFVLSVRNSGNEWAAPAALFPHAPGLRWDPPPRREAGKRTAPTLEGRSGRSGANNFATSGGLIANPLNAKDASGHRNNADETFVTVAALTASGRGVERTRESRGHPVIAIAGKNETGGDRPPGTDVDTCESLIPTAFDARQSDMIMYGDMAGPLDTDGHSQAVVLPIDTRNALRTTEKSELNRQGVGIGDDGDPAPTLTDAFTPAVAYNIIGGAQKSKNHPYETERTGAIQHKGNCASGNEAGTVIAFTQNQNGDVLTGDISAAMGTNQNATGRNTPKVHSGMAVRRLTPVECERLQGFEDDWTLIPYRGKPAADGPRYRSLGNSMAVPVMRWIAMRIQMVEDVLNGH